jgi:hypothetical protein
MSPGRITVGQIKRITGCDVATAEPGGRDKLGASPRPSLQFASNNAI